MGSFDLFALSMIVIGLLLVLVPTVGLVAYLIVPDDWPSFRGRIAGEPKYHNGGLVEPWKVGEAPRVGETVLPTESKHPIASYYDELPGGMNERPEPPTCGAVQWRKTDGVEDFTEHLKRAMREGM